MRLKSEVDRLGSLPFAKEHMGGYYDRHAEFRRAEKADEGMALKT
jgi:hypothetical protein